MISVAEALARLIAPLEPLGAEQVSLAEAVGRVLAEDVVSRRTQPPFAVSAMDGYAVRAADVATVPARLRVVGSVPAGQAYAGSLGKGEAVRIFTGAPVPDGADCIVIQEDTAREGDIVVVREGSAPGRYVRPAGLDFRAGEVGLTAGRRLTARDVGLAAAMNRPWLLVHRRPRVAILPTGDEVVMPGDPVGPHQIVSSNGLALGALVSEAGGLPVQLAIAPDDSAGLQRIAAAAAGSDLLVTTGGASVGEHDLIRDALGATGLTLDFWTVAMRPGKPLMVGRYRDTPMIGLPGNPVSSLVCGLLFVKPAIERLQGLASEAAAPARARLAVALGANDRRQDYLRAKLRRAADGTLEVEPFAKQDSSMLSLLAQSDCLVVRPPDAPAAAKGAWVEIIPLGGPLPLV
ncbi:MAG TPA: gephyrin-like molybdotransferase Glp [Stellaceae bacterium]|nr:gephyrin-like molybdotransferase Glp [Stellaceae bacterium]